MKAVILADGLGTRLSEETILKPIDDESCSKNKCGLSLFFPMAHTIGVFLSRLLGIPPLQFESLVEV